MHGADGLLACTGRQHALTLALHTCTVCLVARKSDRPPLRDEPTLGARVLMSEIEQIARAKHLVGFRVAYKRNANDEHVVALIFPSQPP